MTFGEDMDTSVIPPVSHFSLDIDGVPKTPDSVTWANNRCIVIDYAEGALAPVSVNLQFLPIHPNLKTAAGRQIGSFTSIGSQFAPTASASWNLGTEEISISLNRTFNDLTVLEPNDWILYVAGAPTTLDAINFDSPTQLFGEVDILNPGAAQVDIEFNGPNGTMVLPTGQQVPPFKILDIHVV